MKYFNNTLLIVGLSLFLVACNTSSDSEHVQNKKIEEVAKEPVTPNNETTLAVSGMMCSIGCAGLIESELNKTAGIASAHVIFEDSIASVSFDDNVISENEIIAAIENLADHQYKAKAVQVEEATSEEESAEQY